jgi:hypothetical protein
VKDEAEPMLLLAGSNDVVVSARSVERRFEAAEAPAVFANLRNGSHFEVLGDGRFRYPTTAWARWYLMGDTDARGVFVGDECELCSSRAWPSYRTNALFDEDPGVPSTK